MTSFTDEEEDQLVSGRLGIAWLLDVALRRGAPSLDDVSSAWISARLRRP